MYELLTDAHVCTHVPPPSRPQVENLEVVADTLEELWLSYNSIEKLVRSSGADCFLGWFLAA